jgi:hypothetical protein
MHFYDPKHIKCLKSLHSHHNEIVLIKYGSEVAIQDMVFIQNLTKISQLVQENKEIRPK